MSKWIDFSVDERKAMIQGVAETMSISESAVEKDWWVRPYYMLFLTQKFPSTYFSKVEQV